jgi:hypothetical protein
MAPSRKVTVPVAAPPNFGAMLAVRVTAWPKTEVEADTPRFVVLAARATVSAYGAEELARKLAFPLYEAVREWDPTDREPIASDAWELVRGAVPIAAAPS